jgi:hypothetical protein
MCSASEKLIAWLDGELAASDAVAIKNRLRGCAECRGKLTQYKRLSKMVDAYSDAALESRVRFSSRAASAAVSAAATAAILAAVFLLWPQRMPPLPAESAVLSAAVSEAPAAAPLAIAAHSGNKARARLGAHHKMKAEERRSFEPPAIEATAGALDFRAPASAPAVAVPSIEVVLPAASLFAPGAIPEGVEFVADLSLAADGSPGPFRLGF